MLFPQYEDKHNADFIKKVNVAILEMKENGRYDEIYKEYFD
jgi:cystine transport system substrate-binding protein